MPEANEDVDWEAVVHSNEQRTDRLAVPGGWLYRVRQWKLKPHEGGRDNHKLVGFQVVFVPDPAMRG